MMLVVQAAMTNLLVVGSTSTQARYINICYILNIPIKNNTGCLEQPKTNYIYKQQIPSECYLCHVFMPAFLQHGIQ